MKPNHPLNQPYIRARIIGIIPLLIGASFLFNPTSLNIKIGFTSMLIGAIWIILITEKSMFDVLEKIIREYNLSGNAVFLPKSKILSEERIYIPKNKSDIKPPYIDDDSVLIKNTKKKILGLSLLPSGKKLLKEIEKEVDFEDIDIENVEGELWKFVSLNLLKSIHLEKHKGSWKLILEKPVFCRYDQNVCKQYPCPTCSAALTAITRATKKKIRIKDTKIERKKITFDLKIGG